MVWHHLNSVVMSVQLTAENMDSLRRQSCCGTLSDAISRQVEVRLARWNGIFGPVLEAEFHDSGVEFPQCRRVMKA